MTVKICVLCWPAPESRCTSKVIGLPAASKHWLGSFMGSNFVPVDRDDPIPFAESGLLGRRVFADRADRLNRQAESEIDKVILGERELGAIDRQAVHSRRRDRPTLDHVRDRLIGVACELAIVFILVGKSRRFFAIRAGGDQDVDHSLALFSSSP